jgi:NAD(P) transhydrogenase subunit alpha
MGVGVAGLQAIATARRLGAVVTATDVRPATKEQVDRSAQIPRRRGRGIQERPDRRRLRQGNVERVSGQAGCAHGRTSEAGHRHHHGADPGRPAPKLVSAEMVKSMKPGSVLVDLAVERGGNVEGARLTRLRMSAA